ncbi:MAG TPA: hypothetical protein PK357_00160 [Candidatus Pacearchaeota archaeon]|nr:hypothetical protein [Candidatus Pacearchaeota archaeon]
MVLKKRNFFKLFFVVFFIWIFLAQISILSADLTTDIANGDADYLTDSSKWSNLTQNWKQGILSTGVFSGIDSFFKKLNPFFSVIFGDPYSLSFFFFFVLVLWFWFFAQFRKLLGMTLFSKWVVLLFALTIMVAQLGLFRGLSSLFVRIIFIPNKPWLGIVFFFLIIFILSFISRLGKMIEKKLKKSREDLEKEKEKINRKTLSTITDSASKMFLRDK